jgi:hypothetical protein
LQFDKERGAKMEPQNINNDIAALPPEAQRQVIDFIEFLKIRYKKIRPDKKTIQNKIANDPFIGIWEDREDMKDSNQWVRSTRESEWGVI